MVLFEFWRVGIVQNVDISWLFFSNHLNILKEVQYFLEWHKYVVDWKSKKIEEYTDSDFERLYDEWEK